MRKRVLAAGIAAALIFAACGGDDDDGASTTDGGTEAPATVDTGTDETVDTAPDESPAETTSVESLTETTAEVDGPADEMTMPVQPEVIRIAPTGFFQGFDPLLVGTTSGAYLAPALEGLARIDETGVPVPSLAESWEIDGNTYTFTIREGVTFSDGTPLDADAVAVNLERGRATAGPNSPMYAPISGIEVVDDLTVQVTLSEPRPAFLIDLANSGGWMVSPAKIDAGAIDQDPIGTGPWTYDAGASQETVHVFTRNDEYWGGDTSTLAERIEVLDLQDPAARVSTTRAGQVDLVQLTGPAVDEVKGAGIRVDINDANRQLGLVIQDRNGDLVPALGNEQVRQALQLAVDREAFGAALFPGGGFTPSVQGFDEASFAHIDGIDAEWPYDPERARELLTEAGYPDGFEFTVPIIPPFRAWNEAVAGYFADIGVTMNLELITIDLPQALPSGDYPGWLSTLPYSDPDNFRTQFFNPGVPYDPFNAEDPELTALGEAAAAAPADDPDARAPLYQEYYSRVIDQGYIIGLGQILPAVGVSDQIGEYVWPAALSTPLLLTIQAA